MLTVKEQEAFPKYASRGNTEMEQRRERAWGEVTQTECVAMAVMEKPMQETSSLRAPSPHRTQDSAALGIWGKTEVEEESSLRL